MDKIATPQDLQAALRRIIAMAQSEKPSRAKIAAELRALAAATDEDLFKPKRQHKSLGSKMYSSGLFMPPSKRELREVATALMDGKPVSRKKIQDAAKEVDRQSKESDKDAGEKKTLEKLRDELQSL